MSPSYNTSVKSCATSAAHQRYVPSVTALTLTVPSHSRSPFDSLPSTETQRSEPQRETCDRQRVKGRCLEGIHQQVWKHYCQRVLRSIRREFLSDQLQQQDWSNWERHLPPQGTSPPFLPRHEVEAVPTSRMFLCVLIFLQRFFPYALIKFDVDAGKPLRDSAGFCIEADKGVLVTRLYVPLRTQSSRRLFEKNFQGILGTWSMI